MVELVDVKPLPSFRLELRYNDGTAGVVDLSHLVGRGVFQAWHCSGIFEDVSIGPSGEIRWNDTIELCPHALYLQLTGKTPEEMFPNLRKAAAKA
jgi:hypothetical protein